MNYSRWMIAAMLFAGSIAFIGAFYAVMSRRRAKWLNKSSQLDRHSGSNMFYFLYRLFKATPGLNRIFHKVIMDTESVFPADPMSVNKEATKVMLKNLRLAGALILFTFAFAKGDLWYLAMGTAGAMVIFYQNIQASYTKKEYTLLVQLREALSSIRHHYTTCYNVEDSIEDCLEEVPYEISLHLSKIHDILISPTIEEDTEEYTQMSPNRFLLLLLSIASSTKEYSNGEPGFLKSLSYLKEEIGQEILKKNLIRTAFKTMQGICISTIFILKPMEIWVINNMPETKGFYSSQAGKALMVGLFILSFCCFYMIDVLKEGRRGEIVRQSVFSRLASIKQISGILNRIVNHRYVYYLKLNEDLKEVGDQTGPKAFIARQILFAAAAFFCINSAVLVSNVHDKLTMLSEYVAEFDKSIIPNDQYRKNMEEMAKNYVMANKRARLRNLDVEVLTEQIQTDGIQNDEYAAIVAEEVIRELTVYKNTYYKWYVLVLSLLAAAFAYQIPKIYLKFRIRISNMNKEDEVNQFNTLVLILSNADGIKLDEILEWISLFAYSFKTSIDECINDLEHGVQKALEKLKDSESNDSFRRFVDCLLMIDDSDMKTAFSEVEIDRQYSLSDRKQRTEELVHTRSNTGHALAFGPPILALILYLIVPMLILAVRMYMQMDMNV